MAKTDNKNMPAKNTTPTATPAKNTPPATPAKNPAPTNTTPKKK